MTVQSELTALHAPSTSRDRDYRAFTTCMEPVPWLSTVDDQLSSWLRQKKWDVDVNADGTQVAADGRAAISVRRHHTGHERALQVVLEEDNGAGHWTTRVTAVERERGGGWVSLDVHSADRQFVRVPRLARFLTEALHLHDGSWELRDAPRVVHADQIDELVALLTHPERRGAVFVAGTDTQLDFAAFRSRVQIWGREVVGLGHVVVLDPDATAAMQSTLGRAWSTQAWTVRTYLPRLDLEQPSTAHQHRTLGTHRLAQDRDGYLTTLLGGFARSTVARHSTPPPLVSWQRTFDRLDNAAIAEAMNATVVAPPAQAIAAAPADTVAVSDSVVVELVREDQVVASSVGAEAETFLAELDRVRQMLGVPDLSDETLRRLVEQAAAPRVDTFAQEQAARRIDKLQREKDELQQQLDQVKDELEIEQLEHDDTREEAERHADRSTWLGKELAAAGKHELAHAVTPDDAIANRPSSFEDLLARAPELADLGVVITADEDTVRSLDARDSTGAACRTAWDSLLALADYVRAQRAGDCTGNVHQYLLKTPNGYRGMPPKKHSWTETATTMNQYGETRELPVPTDVDPSGCATMRAHFKLARIGMVSPRLYYLDDVAGSGKVFVGYIGPHLKNTQSN
jgi:hypothetical protein